MPIWTAGPASICLPYVLICLLPIVLFVGHVAALGGIERALRGHYEFLRALSMT
jgi:hypothetical protein